MGTKTNQHTHVYLELGTSEGVLGRLQLELFQEKLPLSCQNFQSLCVGDHGMSYQGSVLHRIVPGGWIQGGDICGGTGEGGKSIYGDKFPDENFVIRHDRAGIIGMANSGRHSNASQFYITLQPAQWMDMKYVAFGEVKQGMDILKKLEKVPTLNERPMDPVTIVACGLC